METQLCLALADLAIQMFEWTNPVQHMIEVFGKDKESVGCLLEFLTLLPEEITNNYKIPIEKDDLIARSDKLLADNANEMLKLILYYMESSGSDTEMQNKIFDCLYSWLRSGDIKVATLPATPVIEYTFSALQSDDLFDVVVDVICEIIGRSGYHKVMPVIEAIYPRLLPLSQMLQTVHDDPEKVRGLCRIFTEAGESYVKFVVQNFDAFSGIVEGLLQCAAYEDLEIVRITFNFWSLVASDIILPEFAEIKPKWLEVYRRLMDIMIKHLHYPADLNKWTAQERDEFRDFRHRMGDVLKDCVLVLGQEEALSRPFAVLRSFVGNAGVDVASHWQAIEAQLFALRAMGQKISNDESKILPQIMELLPQLPNNSKIKYATILVIGRYAGWTARHPSFIPYQLNFISKGFEDDESMAAAALALRYLCESCGHLLVDYLGQLHPFYTQVSRILNREDRREVTEAIAHVINCVPLPELSQMLQSFCLPIAQRLHEIAQSGKPAADSAEVSLVKDAQGRSKKVSFKFNQTIFKDMRTKCCLQTKNVTEMFDQLSIFMKHVRPQDVPKETPHPCVGLVQSMWPVFDHLMDTFGDSPVAESFARCFRYCMQSYRWHFVPVMGPLMTKTVALFDRTGLPPYLWVAEQCVKEYGNEDTEDGKQMFALVETMTGSTFRIFQAHAGRMDTIPDVVEDYFYLIRTLMDECPTLFCESALLQSVFQCGLACLAIEHEKALRAVLRFFEELFKIVAPSVREHSLPQSVTAPVFDVVRQQGLTFTTAIFHGLLYTFPRSYEVLGVVGPVMKMMADMLPQEVLTYVRTVVGAIAEEQLSAKDKEAFFSKFSSACEETETKRVQHVLSDFAASYRRRNLIQSRSRKKTH
ncbi:Nuclear import receptor [Quaeritorhiza haematococci]|nr:Nuclear import receptor [Quaeritorhiza haematococci]